MHDAEKANIAKSTFLFNMSHDLRTPMNAIIGFTTLALSNIDDTERVKDYLGKTLASSKHLLSLINDVLDMSRIESGKIHLEEVEVNLSDVLHDLKTIVTSSPIATHGDAARINSLTSFIAIKPVISFPLLQRKNAAHPNSMGCTASERLAS